jgi:UDP-2,3-diacylglucosamine hydrolase
LLGDVFEAWVGDDQPDQSVLLLGTRLLALSERGIRVFMMRGNRDFLMGSRSPGWPKDRGAQLLEDAVCISLFGTPVLITHGDSLCTDDVDYQQFRAQVRSPQWQAEFLCRPLAERLHLARHMREQSEINKAVRAQASLPMDVNAAAVRALARDGSVRHLIHGHTHRPAHHEVDGLSRWVLPDWHADGGRGGFLRVDARGWQMIGRWH